MARYHLCIIIIIRNPELTLERFKKNWKLPEAYAT